jgi:raffinose/stachyose/melibiose transport system substrate-binding protein
MQAKGITPFSVGNGDWRGANEWHVTVVLNHFAGPDNVYKALKGELPWTAPVFQQAIGVLNDWYQKGWFGKDYFSLTSDQQALRLAKGEAGMAPNGTFSFDFMTKAFAQTGQELGVAPLPSLRDGVPYPTYAIGIGSTFSINKSSQNPDGAAAFLDYVYSDTFYDKISKDWPGDWNLPLTSISEAKLEKNVSPLFAATVSGFAKGVQDGHYGYTTWTYWPPATEDYLIRGIEQVWLNKITVAQYLQTMQDTFAKELKDGKVPPLAAR